MQYNIVIYVYIIVHSVYLVILYKDKLVGMYILLYICKGNGNTYEI